MVDVYCKISVVIPSYNRSDALPRTLQSLGKQTVPAEHFEVIVVDDGSTDGTVKLVQTLQPLLPYSLTLLKQDHQRQAAARNRGAAVAEHPLLLFLDSDVIATERLLQAHMELQAERGPALVAGARRFWPRACTTTFSKVQEGTRLDRTQFTGRPVSYQQFFSANLSIPAQLFRELGGFDEKLFAFEDTDLAYRAYRRGVTLLVSEEALGYHNHPMTLQQACRQQEHYQKYAALFLHKHPELSDQIDHLVDKAPINWRQDSISLILRKSARKLLATQGLLLALQPLAAFLERAWPHPALLRFIYWKILGGYMLKGYRAGLQRAENTLN